MPNEVEQLLIDRFKPVLIFDDGRDAIQVIHTSRDCEMELTPIGSFDQDLVTRLRPYVSHRGALHQDLSFFGGVDSVLLAHKRNNFV